jgi:hypothetical protein
MWSDDELNSRNRAGATHKEGNENSSVHKNQGQDGSHAVAETVGDGSGHKNTDKSTTLPGLEEGTLPSGWDGHTGSLHLDTVPIFKRGKCDKVTVQEHVERLHDLGDGHQLCVLHERKEGQAR